MISFNLSGLEVAWIPGRVDFPRHSLTVMAKGTFRLLPGGIATMVPNGEALRIDGDRHIADDIEKSLEYTSDFAIYKPKTDLLFKGQCHTPNGEAQTACKVSFGLDGDLQNLMVIGDRQWQSDLLPGKSMTAPQPFSRMPLCYENSFGGDGFDANPVGKGHNNNLPNIEHPDFIITSPGDRPQPEGFAPLHSLWQPRRAKMGTFNKQWEEHRWPWFPEDMDWSLFNAAPPALQRSGYLKGDETLVMENLHATIPNYRCQLPALRSRCFINAGDQEKLAEFKEVKLELDTLWVDGDEEILVLVWRGIIPISDRFHDELKHLLLVTEPLDSAPQAEDVYRSQLAQLLLPPEEEKIAGVAAEPESQPEAALNVDAAVKKALDESRSALKGMNLPAATMTALNQEQNPAVFLDLLIKALGIDPEAAARLEHENLLNNRKLLEERGYDPNLAGRLSVGKITTREDVIGAYAEGRDFSGVDLSNLDLQDLDLHGAQFSHTLLFNAKLNNCNLTGANLNAANLDNADLSSATLVGADLAKATLRKAKLAQANLQSAQLQEAKLDEADLSQTNLGLAQLQKTRFDSCMLKQANLQGADLSEARLVKAELTGANLVDSNAAKAVFTEAVLDDARLENSDLSNALLNQCSLRRANLSFAILIEAQFKQTNLETALLTRVQAGQALFDEAILDLANLDEADFSLASLNRATLKGSSMRATRFKDANLEKAVLDDVEAGWAEFSGAKMVSAQLQKGRLGDADFSAADVSNANFEQADLTRANFKETIASHVNMRLANLTELRAGGGSNFDHANLEQVSANGAIWMQSSLREANLKWADMHRCNLNQADMSGACCVAADIKQSDLTRSMLKDANFTDSNLFESQLENANLTRTNFAGSNMYSAFFLDNVTEDGNLQKANFVNANLKGTLLASLAEDF